MQICRFGSLICLAKEGNKLFNRQIMTKITKMHTRKEKNKNKTKQKREKSAKHVKAKEDVTLTEFMYLVR